MLLFLMFKTVNNERLPIAVGMLPLKPILERSKPVTLELSRLQFTPIQLQKEVSRDQFVDTMSEFMFARRVRRDDSSILDVF